jgi:hypothetical protein
MEWGWIYAAYGKVSNADKISVRKLERKRQCGKRGRLEEGCFKTDPELNWYDSAICVTVVQDSAICVTVVQDRAL